ncbi:MAG: DUF2934 domain-containing protein [bacterium]|nr:DUF2934 domain-containing protein [bacterium]
MAVEKRTIKRRVAGRKAATKGRPRPRAKAAPQRALTPQEVRRMIREKAYEIYVRRGRAHGRDRGDWFEAERIVESTRP